MALQKAMILVDYGGSKSETIEVLFNPSEYSLQAGNKYQWHTVPGLSMPVAQFVSGETSTLTMDLFFDTYEANVDVRKHTGKIMKIMDVDKDLHVPPICRFVWGSLDFQGIIEKVSQKFTMFLDTGVPVRATLNVTFKESQSVKEQYEHIPRQSADRTKQKTINQGEQLWMIASEEYEDPGLWRDIAKANQIDNPRHLKTGRKLIIPRLE